MDIIKQLSGGDRRSIGKVNFVVNKVLKEPSLFDALFNGLFNEDDVVRMRAADAIEKISKTNPEILKPYKRKFIYEISQIEQQEVRWHLAQIFPRLNMTDKEKKEVINILKNYLNDKSKIVKTFAMQALTDFAEQDENLKKWVICLLKDTIEKGSPAMQSRAKKLLGRF